MVTITDTSIFSDLSEYSVILNPCNTKGHVGVGLSNTLYNKWPQSYNEYHEYCGWFKDGHEKEILGTFVGVKVEPKLIICNAIIQYPNGRSANAINMAAFERLCKKINRQTNYVNSHYKTSWKIHGFYRTLSVTASEAAIAENDQYLQIINNVFGDSPVEFILHKYYY